MCASTGSRSLRASSGSRSASSSMEPLRSAKSTVTCLRSPSSAAFEVRILSAKCFGVYDSVLAKRVGSDATAEMRSPHCRQNLAEGGSSLRHLGQVSANRDPHSRQNFAVVGFSCAHCGHFIKAPTERNERAPAASFNDLHRRGGARISGSNATERLLLHRNRPTQTRSGLGHVWTAPLRQVLSWRAAIAVGCRLCLACWCSHCSRLLALMWFARWVLIISLGSTPVTQRRFSRLDDRPINIMPSAPPQPVTPYGVFLLLWLYYGVQPLRRSPRPTA